MDSGQASDTSSCICDYRGCISSTVHLWPSRWRV